MGKFPKSYSVKTLWGKQDLKMVCKFIDLSSELKVIYTGFFAKPSCGMRTKKG